MNIIRDEVIKLNIQRLFIQEEHLENSDIYTEDFIKKLLVIEVKDILKIATRFEKKVLSGTIPQFSNFNDGTKNILNILEACEQYEPNYLKLGRYLTESNKKDGAYIKYGENHSKLANILGIAFIDNEKKIYITDLGKLINKLNNEDKKIIFSKLVLKIPIIIEILRDAEYKKVDPLEVLKKYLAESTALRRRSNILCLLRKIKEVANDDLENLFLNIEGI